MEFLTEIRQARTLQNNLAKNSFLAQFKIVQNFHYFCKVGACRISIKNSIFQKLPQIL